MPINALIPPPSSTPGSGDSPTKVCTTCQATFSAERAASLISDASADADHLHDERCCRKCREDSQSPQRVPHRPRTPRVPPRTADDAPDANPRLAADDQCNPRELREIRTPRLRVDTFCQSDVGRFRESEDKSKETSGGESTAVAMTRSRPQSPTPRPTIEMASTSADVKVVSAMSAPAPTTPAANRQVQPPRTADPPTHLADPLSDFTHIRIRPKRYHCLYPGATFQGTQKSGRSDYDVTVTIMDLDLDTSFLCGYLCIRGLTDDWPEMTTYFDAEIIDTRYGFLTNNWGATEPDDMVHWDRFPAFRRVKQSLRRPNLTLPPGHAPGGDAGAVFMRWKERFLVPDHRVQDISGASFAGFYYVCVDFNPPPPSPILRTTSRRMSSAREPASPIKAGVRADAEDADANQSRSPRATGTALMSGFYFHQNSEPYQQLSLSHVPEEFRPSFEFR